MVALNVDKISPGPELDTIVAEEVFGWKNNTIPIVMTTVTDPVGTGLVASLRTLVETSRG